MNYKGLWTMWYRFDENNVKYIKKFPTDFIPGPAESGFTVWKRGTGPLEPIHYQNVVNGVRRACLGIPKKPETKLKMSEAKKGVPKSVEHRKNMSIAHQRRLQNEQARKTQNQEGKQVQQC